MALPSFRPLRSKRRHAGEQPATGTQPVPDGVAPEQSSERTLTPNAATTYPAGVDIKRATRTRRNASIASAVLFLIAVVFLILVVIGQVREIPVLRSTWFFALDLADVYATAFGTAGADGTTDILFVNSIARSLGLHDFYRVGLWNFCEGYADEGVTYCSPPQNLYWFNPVEILVNELFAGATLTLPADINDILNLIKLASQLMFGFFITGLVLCFVSVFAAPLALYSRWWSLGLALFTFVAALCTTAATVIATAMFLIFRNVITSQQALNIRATVGVQMFAFMWVATACALVAWILQLGLACCCASRRDVRTGRKRGSRHAYSGDAAAAEKTPVRRRGFFRRKTAGQTV